MSIEFNEIPDWVCWIAMDEDGVWWGYQVEPNQSHQGWYENEIGNSVRLGQQSQKQDWRLMLKRIKQ